ncbi:MAG TPA: type II toxin-antitoxin system HicB family antitoxin [Candidatus Absconditabacterales bacterium]|nr:type II toxin-antitoxin system HicB family antitoxin [Candidatus Absconditabacterales bacterium]HOQ78821.1 type II toxin-antitoxin system HicB family antitoxin [Candidatus Absconditabacterales bacterium]
MKKKYQIVIERDENNYFVGEVVGLLACYTQAKTVPELLSRLLEVTEGSIDLVRDIQGKDSLQKFNLSMKIEYA